MTRLDKHVAAVQTKIFARRFLDALAWTTLIAAGVVLLGVVVNIFFRIFTDYLPNFPVKWVLIGLGVVSVTAALVWAIVHKPSRHQAAVAIDEKLRLKEKFSTAIYVRPSGDAFAQAAVRDAEVTAEKVLLAKQFPIAFPKPAYTMMLLVAAAFLLGTFVKPLNLFAAKTDPIKKVEADNAQQAAKENVARAIAAVQSMPQSTPLNDEMRKLVAELNEFNKAPKIEDPAKANRRALQALQEVNNEVAKEWDKAKKYAEAQNAWLQSLQPPDDAKGPVGKAREQLAKGNFEQAKEELKKAAENFDKMSKEDKEDAAKQMQQAANQLQQLAQNAQMQQQIQQQLQQMGLNQQQAQQMQQQIQQAAQQMANGDPKQQQQAAQQMQQMAQQLAQQMNNGQGANQQQQQQIQQAMQQMQAQANAQNQANAMAQAAQQMAQAMQQAAQQQQQGGNGQQNPQQAQQMQQAMQQVQQAMNNMQGVQQMLQQQQQAMQQAQQNLQQGQQCANGQCQGGNQPGNKPGDKPGQGGQGQFAKGDPNQKGQGMGGPGQGEGGAGQREVAPFTPKPEQSQSHDDEKGKILASYLVKDQALKGDSKAKMAEAIAQAQKEATDEVDAEHVNPKAAKAAGEYFRTMEKEATGK